MDLAAYIRASTGRGATSGRREVRPCVPNRHGRCETLPCTRLEVDELWSFIYAKNKNVARAKSAPPEAGDVWTWIAICADTKLVPTWRIGDRTSATGLDFMACLEAGFAGSATAWPDRARGECPSIPSIQRNNE